MSHLSLPLQPALEIALRLSIDLSIDLSIYKFIQRTTLVYGHSLLDEGIPNQGIRMAEASHVEPLWAPTTPTTLMGACGNLPNIGSS